MQFFTHGKILFENPEFKMALAMVRGWELQVSCCCAVCSCAKAHARAACHEEGYVHPTSLLSQQPTLLVPTAPHQGFQQGKNPQELVDQAQAKIWEEKVEPAVQGDYGISCLAKVLNTFKNDAEFLKMFFE